MNATKRRETKYHTSIRYAVTVLDHPTNHELLQYLRAEFPALTATTVHRATARLAERGDIGVAPSDKCGAIRYDANPTAHDHFRCQSCDRLCDANIRDKVIAVIKADIKDCKIPSTVVLSGVCKDCV